MITSILSLMLAQVGPNPNVSEPITPPEVAEQRRQTAERERQATASVAAQNAAAPSRLSECLASAAQDAETGEAFARAWLETATPEDRALALHCLGLSLVRQDRFADAREAFDNAREAAPATNPAYRARLSGMSGHAALAQGQADLAVPAFERAIMDADSAADPALTAGLNTDLARALVAANRAPDAVAALAAARDADPSNAQAWLLSATLARRLERLGEAQRHIEYAATLAPRDPAIGLEAGVIAAMAGREDQARASFASVIEVAPDSVEAGRARTYLTRLDGGAHQEGPSGR